MNRPVKLLSILLLALLPVMKSSPAAAAPKDAAALKLDDEAINTHYLATNFNEAVKSLQKAIKLCGASGCSAKVLGQLHRDLGIVYMVGLQKAAEGRAELAQALKADPNVTLDKDLAPPEVQQAFAEIKSGGGGGGGGDTGEAPAGGGGGGAVTGDIQIKPPLEQAILTPVPIYVELPDGVKASKVTVRYKTFGSTEWKTAEMRRSGDGYAYEIPCLDVGTTTGDLKFYVQAVDSGGDIVANSGTRNSPLIVPIKRQLDGEPPHLPGKPPPSQCPNPGDCPPGFPGCSSKPSKKQSCDTTADCPSGATCNDGVCEGGEGEGGDAEAKSCETASDCDAGQKCDMDSHTCKTPVKSKRLILSLAIQPDFGLVSGTDVCSPDSQSSGGFACFDSVGPYGAPTAQDEGGKINSGFATGSVRAYVGLDYALNKNLTIGARVGAAFNGAPPTLSGKKFFPFHGELRATYYFGKDALATKGVHPFVMAFGGLAEVDLKVRVKATLDPTAATMIDPAGDGTSTYAADYPPTETVDAWKKLGQSFAGAGAGVLYALSPSTGFVLDVRLMQMFPTAGTVIAPEIAYMFAP